MFEKEIVIDGKGHLRGRLASYVAKELLNGQRIVIVRAEKVNIAGSFFRNRIKFMEWMNKRMLHNPRRNLQHYKSPSRILYRTIRGQIPRFSVRGDAALGRLKVFEGVPAPYDTKKRKVIPDALRQVRLRSDAKNTNLGDICSSIGWTKKNLVEKLEEKRIVRSNNYYKKKLAEQNARRKVLNQAPIQELQGKLAKFGY